MTNTPKDLRDWMFRGLTFESEADRFRDAGIQIGAEGGAQAEHTLLLEELSPFGIDMRNQALEMARLYATIFCFENSIRNLIKQRLQETHGVEWWEKGVPSSVRKVAESRKKDAEKSVWLEGEKGSMLGFATFGHLASIITENWDSFSDLIPTQHWLKQRMEELEESRNYIAHNRMLLSTEFERIYMYVRDWNRQVGL